MLANLLLMNTTYTPRKSISIILETLSSGLFRSTGRHNGRTVESFEGKDARSLVMLALKSAASAHELPSGGFDMTYIDMNEAARVALYPR